jgi:hypothetical protein
MSQLSLNIVAFDIPYPADYGGIIDIYYKVKSLHKSGVEIILHCFQYHKQPQPQLEKYCKKVYYYKRKKGLWFLFSKLPYIVVTRSSEQLLNNLLQNDFPILFEGLHTCFFLGAQQLQHRKKFVRTHNIEHEYYHGLQEASKNPIKKLYYFLEKRKLKRFEAKLKYADTLLTLSENDNKYFNELFGSTALIQAFTPFNEVKSLEGSGDYFLFHGKLSVEENYRAVQFLIQNVFNELNHKLIIAGKNPSDNLTRRIQTSKNIELIANPDNNKMENLIRNAHACILPGFQVSGIKLKLLYSLFRGRHVIANHEMVTETNLKALCVLASTQEEFKNEIKRISEQKFTKLDIQHRSLVLNDFASSSNTNKLLRLLKNNA